MVCILRIPAVTITITPLESADVTFAMSECSKYRDALLMLSVVCSYMIDILHVERNKDDVSSHLKSSLYLFHVPFYLPCPNSL